MTELMKPFMIWSPQRRPDDRGVHPSMPANIRFVPLSFSWMRLYSRMRSLVIIIMCLTRMWRSNVFSVTERGLSFLIDEAHNLVDRAREMYSAVMSMTELTHAPSRSGR